MKDLHKYDTWDDLVVASKQARDGATAPRGPEDLSADERAEIKLNFYQQAQRASFPEESTALESGKDIPRRSQLLKLSPEWDPDDKVI